MDNLKEKRVFIFDAEDGMKLSRDIVSTSGQLIAAKGTCLDMKLISKISTYSILEIYVCDATEGAVDQTNQEQLSYYNRIRSTADFKEFNDNYQNDVKAIKDGLNNIVFNNGEIDGDLLIKGTMGVIQKYNNSLQIFDMLHSMRNYDDQTFVHSINVSIIAALIGKWMRFDYDDINLLALAGILHDIGKLKISEDVLNKPGKLTSLEYGMIKEHASLGYQILKNTNLDDRIKSAALLHHEKCDGSGYPYGIDSSGIPDFTKIITIADIYDAMTANRVYRQAICPFTVINEMSSDALTKFDPKFIIPFLKNVASSYIGTTVRLSDGRSGEVVMINDRNLVNLGNPIVKCSDGSFVDLSTVSGLSITAVL